MSSMHRLVRRVVDVREDELRALALAFAYFFALLCGFYVLRPLREEMGVLGGIRNLPWLFTATFVAMACCVPLYGWVAARWPRRIFVPIVYRFFAACLIAFFLAFQVEEWRPMLARVFFVWVSVFNLFVVSVFWSFMSDLFTSTQGKRLFGFVAAGGTLGALAGPAVTAILAKPLGPVPLILLSVVLLEAATWCVRRLNREAGALGAAAREPHPTAGEKAMGGGVLDGLLLLFRSPYLLGIGLYILFHSTMATFVYLEQADIVSKAFTNSAERLRVFALMDFAVNALTILTQLFLTGRFVLRFGVGWAGAFLPAVNLIGFAALAITPALGTLVAFQIARRASDYAVSKPAREVLYTSVTPEERYKAKNVNDTLVYRGGDAASSWVHDALKEAGLGMAAVALIAVPLALLWIGLAHALGRGHEKKLA